MDVHRIWAPRPAQKGGTSALAGAILAAMPARRRDQAASWAKPEGYDIRYSPSTAVQRGRMRVRALGLRLKRAGQPGEERMVWI